MLFAATQILLDVQPHASRQLPGIVGMTLTGTLTGWLSTLVSVGGGTITVPFLIWCNVPIRHAIGTASAIGLPIAVGGTIGYILTGLHASGLPSLQLGLCLSARHAGLRDRERHHCTDWCEDGAQRECGGVAEIVCGDVDWVGGEVVVEGVGLMAY